MARITYIALLIAQLIFISLGTDARLSPSRIKKQTGTDLGVIGVDELVYGNSTMYANGQPINMQFTFAEDCYARLTVSWDPETSLRSDLDFLVNNTNGLLVMLAISERVPEVTTYIVDSTRDDFGNGTYTVTIKSYDLFVPSVPFALIVETSATSFCSIADDQNENNQSPLDSPNIPLGRTVELSMCNDDWFQLDIKSTDIMHITAETSAPGKDLDFYILDSDFDTIFESNNQGNEEDIIVALTNLPPYYVMFFEANSTLNYTYTVYIDPNESKSKNNLGLVVGLCVGLGAAALIGAGIGFFLFRRHRANTYRKTVTQFVDSSPSKSNYDQLALENQSQSSDTTYASMTRKSQVERADLQRTKQESSLFGSYTSKKRDNYEIDYNELKVIKEIGKGSFGVVYQAQWRQTTVAVKQLKISQMFENVEKGMEDFRREAELLKSLRPHPNVVLFLGITTEPLSIVIEFCDGGSLVALLRDPSKTITFETQVKILLGIARGMLHLHTENIIHRDLAARNILLGQDYIAKVSDFGLSREKRSSVQDKTQSTIGPLKWMSVEAIQGQVFSTKSDVWSFGVVVWEVLCRSEPFPTLDAVNAAMKVCYEGLRLQIPQDCHPVLAGIMRACWELEPSSRPSFEEICNDLSRVESKKTFTQPVKPNFLESSHSNGSSSSVTSDSAMDTTYTSARHSGLKNEQQVEE